MGMKQTFVDGLQLADDVQPHLWEFVLEEMQEKREKVFDSLLLSEERCKAGNLVRDSGTDMLRRVLAEVSDTGNDAEQDDFLVEELGEA